MALLVLTALAVGAVALAAILGRGTDTTAGSPILGDGTSGARVIGRMRPHEGGGHGRDRQEDVGPGDVPVLSLVVRNEGTAACTVNVGTSQMEFVLTSAVDRMFSSIDCQQASQDLERIIEPGGEERATFEWSRNRTLPGCTVVEEKPATGSYALITRLGARSSSPVWFTLQ